MEDAYFGQQSKHDHPGERNEDPGPLPSFYEDEEDDEASSSNSIGSSSSSSDLMEDATSNLPSNGPLFEMSSLISELPFKRGLSKHFEGKSQSFTSLSNVKSLEDLIKPERSFKNKLKPSKSHAWDLDRSLCLKKSSRAITKKSSIKGSFSSLVKKHNFLGSKSLFSPKRSGSISGQILVFAERSLETVG